MKTRIITTIFAVILMTSIASALLGDMNNDNEFNINDTSAFILALTDYENYSLMYPNISVIERGDFNNDSLFNLLDIEGFNLALKIKDCPLNTTKGDMNGDLIINQTDISYFVLAIVSPENYSIMFPNINLTKIGDFNNDSILNLLDISGFQELISFAEVCNITFLNETEEPIVVPTPPSSSGGSSKKSSSSSSSGCVTKWICNDWSDCVEGNQTRECVKERSYCFAPKVNLTQSCVTLEDNKKYIYSNLSDNISMETKTDNEINVPFEKKERHINWLILLSASVFILFFIIIGIIFYIKKKSERRYENDGM